MNEFNTYIDENDVAAMIGVHAGTVRNWRCARRGPKFVRISSRCIRYRVGDVRAWLDARAVETEPSAS